MPEVVFFWSLIVAIIVYYASRAMENGINFFAPPLILSSILFYIFVISYISFDEISINRFIDHTYYVNTLAFISLSLILFCAGFHATSKSAPRNLGSFMFRESMPILHLKIYATIVALFGFAGVYFIASASGGLTALYSAQHGQGAAYATTSAYLYGLQNFLWPSLIIATTGLIQTKYKSRYLIVLSVVVATALFAHTFLNGNRNGVMRFFIILGTCYVFLFRPKPTKLLKFVPLAAGVLLVVLILPNIRHATYLGSEENFWEAVIVALSKIGEARVNSFDATGHELFFNVAAIQAAMELDVYAFGSHYVFPFINLYPRFWWPDKPAWSEFGVNIFDLVSNHAGWNVRSGAAVNQVGLSFLNFGWFGCVLWYFFGIICGSVFRAAALRPNLVNLGALVAFNLATVYWATQSFQSVFNNWLFTILPFFGLPIYRLFFVNGRAAVPAGFVTWRTPKPTKRLRR